jgi:hypothetical protein
VRVGCPTPRHGPAFISAAPIFTTNFARDDGAGVGRPEMPAMPANASRPTGPNGLGLISTSRRVFVSDFVFSEFLCHVLKSRSKEGCEMDCYWPERVTFFVGALILGVLLFLGSTGHNAAKFSDEWMNALGDIMLTICFVVLLPLWLALRAFDIAFIAYRRNNPLQ